MGSCTSAGRARIRSALVWLGEADPVDTQAEPVKSRDDSLGYVGAGASACYKLRGDSAAAGSRDLFTGSRRRRMAWKVSERPPGPKKGPRRCSVSDVKVRKLQCCAVAEPTRRRNLGGLRFVRCEVPRREGQKMAG